MGWLPGSGCVLWIQMDEREGNRAYDLSGYGNHGTRYGAIWKRGKIGFALSFDGVDDLVEVPYSASLDLTTDLTIETWFKPVPYNPPWKRIAVKGTYPDGGGYGFWHASSPTVSLAKAAFYDGVTRYESGEFDVELDKWHHLAATLTGNTAKFYINGILKQTFTAYVATSNLPLIIGARSIYADYFTGLIDEVRVYNRALSAEEIKAHYWYGIIPSLRVPPVAVG